MTTTSPDLMTIYTTAWCGYCVRLKAMMDLVGMQYREVDIEAEPDAAGLVADVNGGNHVVPTVVFPDGSAMSNPSLAQVRTHLGLNG